MNKKQYVLFNVLFVFSIINLIYTLGFFTNFNSFLGIEDDYYNYVQAANDLFFKLAAFSVIIGAIITASKMMKHKELLLINYFILAGYAFLNALSGLTYLNVLPVLIDGYRKADFKFIMKINKTYEYSELVFTKGYIVSFIHFFIAITVIFLISQNIRTSLKRRRVNDDK